MPQETLPGFEGAFGVNNAYSDNFFAFTYDFNHDGWPDILTYAFPGKEAAWYENPRGREGHWQKHVIFEVVDNESPTFTDINGDGNRTSSVARAVTLVMPRPIGKIRRRPGNFIPSLRRAITSVSPTD